MYEAIHARPDGDSTVSRFALTASEYGYDGIVVRNHGDSPASYDPERIRETYGIDVVTGVEVRAEDPSRASGFVGSHREDQTVVLVHGGTQTLNRFAVEQDAVDVLAHPMAGEGDVNHVIAREAKTHGVRIEFCLRDVLETSGGERIQRLQDLRKLREVVMDAGAPYVVSADPRSHLQLRAPRDLLAVGEQIGFSAEQVTTGLQEWRRLAERNRRRQSGAYVRPGVRLESGKHVDSRSERDERTDE